MIFINLGDSYNSHKSKLLIPERFAIMCVDELGLILRNHIVWIKGNPMPESVIDRFSKSYESIFMFVKQPKYYFDLDSLRTQTKESSIERIKRVKENNEKFDPSKHKYKDKYSGQSGMQILENTQNGEWITKGAAPKDSWIINTSPSPEKHFAIGD